MYILITGGAGWVGQILAKKLLEDPTHTLLLVDIVEPPVPKGAKHPQNAKTIKADLCLGADAIVDEKLDAVFLFHGIMSAQSENEFDLGMRVNVDSTRSLLEVLRRKTPGVRVIYSSSLAVYGDRVVDDSTKIMPQSSYGTGKLMSEMLILDMTRRGFIDGFILRFPTLVVRPGKPSAAASSWMSGMIREPMQGIECVVPIEDKTFKSWLCSPRIMVENLVHCLSLSRDIPAAKRQINPPGISVTIQEMYDALIKVGGSSKASLIQFKNEPKYHHILYSWPQEINIETALNLGFQPDVSFEQAVLDYKKSIMEEPLKENKAFKMLEAAKADGYGIVATACYNIEGVLAMVRAAEAKKSPAMILLFPWAMNYANNLLVNFAADACLSAKVPMSLHLDHAQDQDSIRKAANLGKFDSIMVDMSHHEKEENLALTAELVEYCRLRGIVTEAEPGRIEGGEAGVKDTGDLQGLLTTTDEARSFVQTGIKWLAPAFGNVHGKYGARGVQLDYGILDDLRNSVGNEVQLVLHGTDSFTAELYQKCIGHGLSKVNINGEMNNEGIRVQTERAGKVPLSQVMEESTKAMQVAAENLMDWCGSSGKA